MAPPRVLMLGWEFPPFVTGGLGTACHGLTKALTARGCEITFALPRAIASTHSSHVQILAPAADVEPSTTPWVAPPPAAILPSSTVEQELLQLGQQDAAERAERERGLRAGTPPRIDILRLAAANRGAYGRPSQYEVPLRSREELSAALATLGTRAALDETAELEEFLESLTPEEFARVVQEHAGDPSTAAALETVAMQSAIPEAAHRDRSDHDSNIGGYEGDLILAAERYAQFAVRAAQRIPFDVIHAHDWLTYPAGISLARLTGKPLVVHVHATEFDRSGDVVNQAVYNIERRGMHAAVRVIAVSMLTRNLLVNRYGVPQDKIDVVYNGVDLEPATYGIKRIERSERIVLYFGRITMQKGPEYFVRAAKRVLEVEGNVRFVVAGTGDQAASMISMAAAMGIGGKVTFTGFLRGRDIQRMFSMADLYVMPSVSEPFGIAPLEALGHRVPVIISRNSGVAEVLTHALKVNFWDVDDMANKIVAVLRHPPLRSELRDRGWFEVRGISWDGAAKHCMDTYARAIDTIARTRRCVAPRTLRA